MWKEQLMLEIRILCKFLPKNFDDFENFLVPITYLPLSNDRKTIEVKNKRYKIIQEGKRLWLNFTFHVYEIRIMEYQIRYQFEFIKLETKLVNNTITATTTTNNGCLSLFNNIKEYLNYRTNKLIDEINAEMSSYRRIILQNRQRRSSSTKNSIGVSPEPYLDLIMNPFDTRPWNQLSLGNTHFFLI
jgi:hypothetical protein